MEEVEQIDVSMLHTFAEWLVDFVHHFGYVGIFIMSFLESTFMPIPSEVTMIPAGVLVQQGHMNFFIVIIVSTLGAIGGSMFNYFLAYYLGRRFFYNYGKYFFFSHDKIDKIDKFFSQHGDISTFTGRLIPGVRHFISFPAGLAHMNLKKFCIYTGLGSLIWMITLTVVGYYIGDNKAMVKKAMPYVVAAVIFIAVIGVAIYMWRHKNKNKEKGSDGGEN